MASEENQALEGCSAKREALSSQVGNAFGCHVTIGNIRILETAVGGETYRKCFHAGGIQEAAGIARKVNALEALVGTESAQSISEGCPVLTDLTVYVLFGLLLLRLLWQRLCGGRFARMHLVLVGKIQMFEFAALRSQQFGDGV